jgi:hypothetical protein
MVILWSDLLHDWRFTANQFVLATCPLRLTTSNFFSQLNTCGHSQGSVVYNCRWPSPEQVWVPRGSWPYFTVPDSRLVPNLEGQVPVLISPRNTVAWLYPQALDSLFVASQDSQGYGGGIRTRFHTGSLILRFCWNINTPFTRPGLKSPCEVAWNLATLWSSWTYLISFRFLVCDILVHSYTHSPTSGHFVDGTYKNIE